MATGYEVLVPELTVHRKVGDLTDPITGRVIGYQQGQGKTYYKDEVIPAYAVSPAMIEALEDEDHESHEAVSKRIREVSSEPKSNTAKRLGLPFAGYDDMDEDEVLAAMRNLPSSAIQAVKAYESSEEGEGRERILTYNLGFGESPIDRQEGRVSGDHQDGDEDKAVARLKTREVPEEGLVEPGEGITGTGDPEIPHGQAAKEEEEGSKPATRRRSRRTRSSGGSGGSGSGNSGDDKGDGENS